MPLDHSSLAELVDALHVAVGLRLVAVVLFNGQVAANQEVGDPPRLLVLVDDDLPREPAERAAYLHRRTPAGTLDGILITLRSPAEFDSDPPAVYQDVASSGRVLLDASGFLASRLDRLRVVDS